MSSDTESGAHNDEDDDEEGEVQGGIGDSNVDKVAATRRAHLVGWDDLFQCDLEEVVDLDEFNASVIDMDFEPSRFFTGFNGPLHRGYCNATQFTNSSNPLSLSQASKKLD